MTGQYYASYLQHGTATGRLSGDFQQTPRPMDGEPNIRNAVLAPEGWVLLEADHSMLELRLASWKAQEEIMLGLLRAGEDVHKYTGQSFFGPTIDDFQRTVGKIANFLLIYGGSNDKLAEHLLLHMTREQIASLCSLVDVDVLSQASSILHSRWHDTYPGIQQWINREGAIIRAHGFAEAPHGRIRWLPKVKGTNRMLREEAVREGVNHLIQSLASDLTLMGAVKARPAFRELGAVGPWLIHDSTLWMMPEENLDRAVKVLPGLMVDETLREVQGKWGVEIDVPLKIDMKAGKRWGDLTKVG